MTKIEKFFGYLRTLKNYWRNDKGRHDILDFMQAFLIISLTSLIIILALRW